MRQEIRELVQEASGCIKAGMVMASYIAVLCLFVQVLWGGEADCKYPVGASAYFKEGNYLRFFQLHDSILQVGHWQGEVTSMIELDYACLEDYYPGWGDIVGEKRSFR